jgi:hypothetical protein
MTSLPKSRGQAVLTLRELASYLKLRGGGARLGDVVAFVVIDRLGRRPVLIGGFLVNGQVLVPLAGQLKVSTLRVFS